VVPESPVFVYIFIFDLGFRIWDLGFGIWDLGFGIFGQITELTIS